MLRPVSWCSYVLVLMMWSSWDRVVLSGVICWIWFLGGDRGCVPVNNGFWVAEADMTFMLEIYVLIYNHAVGMCQIVFFYLSLVFAKRNSDSLQNELFFAILNLNCGLHPVSVIKPSEWMLNFWTVWFFQNRIRTDFRFSAHPYHATFNMC